MRFRPDFFKNSHKNNKLQFYKILYSGIWKRTQIPLTFEMCASTFDAWSLSFQFILLQNYFKPIDVKTLALNWNESESAQNHDVMHLLNEASQVVSLLAN